VDTVHDVPMQIARLTSAANHFKARAV
jgi:hypothetical protein